MSWLPHFLVHDEVGSQGQETFYQHNLKKKKFLIYGFLKIVLQKQFTPIIQSIDSFATISIFLYSYGPIVLVSPKSDKFVLFECIIKMTTSI